MLHELQPTLTRRRSVEVRAWRSGKFLNPTTVYGIWVGKRNRTQYFQEQWENIFVEIDGVERSLRLTPGFRRRCTEFRDAGGTAIRDW